MFFGNFEQICLFLTDRWTDRWMDRWTDRWMDGQTLLQILEDESKNITTKKQKSETGVVHGTHQMARNEFFSTSLQKSPPRRLISLI